MRAREHVAETLTIVHPVNVVIRRGVDGAARRYRDVNHRDDRSGHVGLPIPQRSRRLQGILARRRDVDEDRERAAEDSPVVDAPY
jgi:hypothetical protein